MIDEQPIVIPPSAPPPPPERVPFWGYADVALMLGLSLPCMFAGIAVMRLLLWAAHLHLAQGVESVAGMLIGYCLLFAALKVIFQVQYDRPLLRSLGWTWAGVAVFQYAVYGFAALIAVGAFSRLIGTPPTSGPIMDMLKDRTSLIAMAIFGTTVAPVAEELAFRGFLQPLLVRSLGPIAGIALAAAFFGGLHFSEYGDSWKSALLVALAGAAFGVVRHRTGSTAAAAVMHASFNGLQFAVLLFAGKGGLP